MILCLAMALLLSGCGWMDGSYVSVTPHQERPKSIQTGNIEAENYVELVDILKKLISDGTQTATIRVENYPEERVESGMKAAISYATEGYALGAYSVEEITYELGTSGGVAAVAVTISYRRSLMEIQQITRVKDMSGAEKAIADALEDCDASAALLVENYTYRDLVQVVQDYAQENPQIVMELPQVTQSMYGTGSDRVVELIFTYQNSRETLRQMQNQVKPVFASAVLYVSGDGMDRQKYAQLYGFLMERFDYSYETSLTPAYSLLRHGVGDSRAFAEVYAAMCREAGMECRVVTGTRAGEARTWNMICDEGYYYHVDLLRCAELGGYHVFIDGDMQSYVWDYSAHPACTGVPLEPEPEGTEEPDA